MTPLQYLIEAVERVDEYIERDIQNVFGGYRQSRNSRFVHEAYLGSLDAAKALHDALLPGWRVGNISQAYASPDETPDLWSVWMVSPTYLDDYQQSTAEHTAPARAWLLAILRAYASQATP